MASGDWKTAPAPSGWRGRPVSAVVVLPRGQVDPRLEPYRSMVLVAPDHIESGSGTLIAKLSAADQGAISGKYLFEAGDTLYSKIRPYLRKAVLADFRGLTSADMYPLRPTAEVAPRFLLAILLGEHFSRFADIVSMRSGFPKINREEFGEYTVALPPLPEQLRIAEILDTLDEVIRKTEQLIAKLRQVKQGLLHDLLTRGIDDNGEIRDPTRHPEQFKDSPAGLCSRDWKPGLLGDFVEDIRYGTSEPSEARPGGVPVLRIPNVQNGHLELSDLKYQYPSRTDAERFSVQPGDLLVIRTNGNPRLLGRCAQVPDGVPRSLFASYLIRIRLVRAQLAPEFAALLMNSDSARNYIETRAATSAGNYNINTSQLRAMPVCVPLREEQERIVATLDRLCHRLDLELAGAEKLRGLKHGLMEDLLTGRVRVTKLLDEAAA